MLSFFLALLSRNIHSVARFIKLEGFFATFAWKFCGLCVDFFSENFKQNSSQRPQRKKHAKDAKIFKSFLDFLFLTSGYLLVC